MKTKSISIAFLSVLSLVAGAATSTQAETFKIPEKHPVVSVTYPDSWKPEEIERGVQGTSSDGVVYLSVEASKSEKGMNEIIDGTFDMFKEHKVEIDKDTKKTNKMEIAGQPAEEMLYSGKDEDGPAAISITVFTIGDHVVVISYWASTDKVAKQQAAIAKIVASMKALDK